MSDEYNSIPPEVLAQAAAASQGAVYNGAKKHIAIVGGGVAGLVSAYRLMQQGYEVTLIEAEGQLGGHTRSIAVKDRRTGKEIPGLFVDLGGELVEEKPKEQQTASLVELCAELDVPLLRRDETPGEQLYYANGRFLTKQEIHDGYAPLATIIQNLKDRMASQDPKVAAEAMQELAQTPSIEDFIAKHEADGRVSHDMAAVIRNAYVSEVGRNCNEQDVLNLVRFIGTDPNHFDPFAGTTEGLTYAKGTSSLVDAIEAKLLAGGAHIHKSTRAEHVDASGDTVKIQTKDAEGNVTTGDFDHVIMAGSLVDTRKIGGIETLGLSDVQMQASKEMGYTKRTKIIMFVKDEPWADVKLPDGTQSDGSFVTNGLIQSAWVSRDNQPAIVDGHRVRPVVVLLGGDASDLPRDEQLKRSRAEYAKLLGKSEQDVFVDENIMQPIVKSWVDKPCDLCCAPGQYGWAAEMAKAPSNNKVSLAGSYIPMTVDNGYDQMGLMSNAGNAAELASMRVKELQRQETLEMERRMIANYSQPIMPAQDFRNQVTSNRSSGWLSWLGL